MSGYCAASDVAALTKNILGGSTAFSASTVPTEDEVNAWITTGCGVLDVMLAAHGYSVPVPSTALAYQMLTRCNTLFAAARTEESRTNATYSSDDRGRGAIFDQQFSDCASSLFMLDLTLAGLSRTTTAKIYTGGISVSAKQEKEASTDRIIPRFSRDQFRFPGTLRQTTSTASGT